MPSDQSSKDDFPRPQIIYEPSVFVREAMIKKWPNLHKVIASGDELAAAYEGIRKTSFWREDPRLRDISRETADEVLDLYNHVVEDGEHIEEFLTNPREVANKLGRRLSDDAVAVIGAAHQGIRAEVSPVLVAVGIIVGVAVVAVAINLAARGARDAGEEIIIDESGRVKLGSRSGAQ